MDPNSDLDPNSDADLDPNLDSDLDLSLDTAFDPNSDLDRYTDVLTYLLTYLCRPYLFCLVEFLAINVRTPKTKF